MKFGISLIYLLISLFLFTSLSLSQTKDDYEEMLKWFPPGKAYTSFFYADILKLETSELYQIAKPIAASIVNTQIRGQNLPEKLIKSAETLAYTAYHSEDYVLKYRALNEENSNTWNKIRSLKKDDKNYDRDYQELRKISDAQNEKIFDLGEDEYLFVVKLPDAATFLQESLESGSMLKTDQTLAGKPVYVVPTEVNTHKGYVNKQLFLYSTNNNILLLSSKPEMLSTMLDSGRGNALPVVHSEDYKSIFSRVENAGYVWKYFCDDSSYLTRLKILKDAAAPQADLDDIKERMSKWQIYKVESISFEKEMKLYYFYGYHTEEEAINSATRAIISIAEMGGDMESAAKRAPEAYKKAGLELTRRKKKQLNYAMKALGSALRDTSVERDKTEVKMVSRLNKKKLKQLVNLQKIGMEMAKTRREIAARKAKEGK